VSTYLSGVLAKYAPNSAGVQTQVNAIWPVIQKWAGQYLLEGIYSGSMAKGTAISLSTDADVFISLSSTTPETLAEIYGSLYAYLTSAGYQASKQNVSIGVIAGSHKIDFVPGKRQSQQGYDHSIYRSRANTWTKTNVKTHVNHVGSSGRIGEIRLTKIWRTLRNLDFPSFYLELAVLDSLSGSPTGPAHLADNFWKTLGYLSTNFPNCTFIDPANTNNTISDDLSSAERHAIRAAAALSRQQTEWGKIVW
jgi:hypothetical protein